jgi:transposase
MSGPRSSPQYDVVADARRRWSAEEKQAIVAEASGACTNVSAVARRHGVSPSLLFRWIKGQTTEKPPVATVFVPLALPAPAEPSAEAKPREPDRHCPDMIEIELANGRRLRVGCRIDGAALRRVIALLEE